MHKTKRPPISQEELRLAGVDLTRYYLGGYYASWRLAKVLTIQKLIDQRHSFYADLAQDIRQYDDLDGAATIAQEVHHGLHFDAIAHCVQYVEDLFALIRAARKPQAFIRGVVTYRAGEVTHEIKTFKAERKRIGQAFHFPYDLTFSTVEGREQYEHGIANLILWMTDITRFYVEHEFFYNQYKHGLTVALRPSNKYTTEQVEQDKRNERRPYLAVFDNLNLAAAIKKGSANLQQGVMMPGFTTPVQRALPELERRNDWLSLVHTVDPMFSFDSLVDHAFKARACIATFCFNFHHAVDPDPNKQIFQLPVNHRTLASYQCQVPCNTDQ
jgi:hypothetical protein